MTLSSIIHHSRATRDFDEARELLTSTYGEHHPVLLGERERFSYEASSYEVGDLLLDHFTYGSEIASHYRPSGDILVLGAVRDGAVSASDGEHRQSATEGGLIWFRPDHPHEIHTRDVTLDFARLDMNALGRAATAMTGLPADRLRIHAGPPVSDALARYWTTTRRWVADRLLADETVAAEPLIRAEAWTMLARATLLAMPNTALDLLADPSAPSSGNGDPAVVRRAVEFIDANAHHDIDLAAIAEAARIGPRGLQAAFRRHRGQTPLEYLRRVRMDGAHRDLQTADPARGDTVVGVANRWSFAHPGRFSVTYRATYGCSPSDTLRR